MTPYSLRKLFLFFPKLFCLSAVVTLGSMKTGVEKQTSNSRRGDGGYLPACSAM